MMMIDVGSVLPAYPGVVIDSIIQWAAMMLCYTINHKQDNDGG